MAIDSTDNNKGNSFEYRLKEVSDEEIVAILKFRDHYQPQAVKAAVREALKRGIISSIDDLENDEFKPLPIPSKRLFPISLIEGQNITVYKSLCRISYGIGIIPTVFGIFQIAGHSLTLGIIALLLGISIIYITFKLEKGGGKFLSQLLLAFNIPAIGFAIYRLLSIKNLVLMDVFAASVIIIILLYTSLYIHKLTIHFNRNL